MREEYDIQNLNSRKNPYTKVIDTDRRKTMTGEKVIDPSGLELMPGRPDLCQGNGEHIDAAGGRLECCCDECDYYLACFDEQGKERAKKNYE